MAGMDLSPPHVSLSDDVGDTQSILVSVVTDGVATDLTLWTVAGAIYDQQGGTSVQAYTVSSGATRVLSITSAQSTSLGTGVRWYAITGTDPSGTVQTFAHGVHELQPR